MDSLYKELFGFLALLFKKFWKIIGSSLIEFVKTVFATGQLPEGVNDSYIPLIPKLKKQERISKFRPIGLCNLI